MKVCLEPGCPTLTTGTRCTEHTRSKDRARGSRIERGYGAEHQARRKAWASLVATGHVRCWRCGEYIPADAAWDLGHDDDDRARYRGPEHQACNRAVNARRISRDA